MTPLYPCAHVGCGERLIIPGLDVGAGVLRQHLDHSWGMLGLDVEHTPKFYGSLTALGGVAPQVHVMVGFCPQHSMSFGAQLPGKDAPHGLLIGSSWAVAQRCVGADGKCAAYLLRTADTLIDIANPPRDGWAAAVTTIPNQGEFIEWLCPRDRRKLKQTERGLSTPWTVVLPDGRSTKVTASAPPQVGALALLSAGPHRITAVDAGTRVFYASPEPLQ